jgi:hypothetical protein
MLIVRILYAIGQYSYLIFFSEKCLDGEGHKKDNGSFVILGLFGKVSSPSFLTHEIFPVTDYILSSSPYSYKHSKTPSARSNHLPFSSF